MIRNILIVAFASVVIYALASIPVGKSSADEQKCLDGWQVVTAGHSYIYRITADGKPIRCTV